GRRLDQPLPGAVSVDSDQGGVYAAVVAGGGGGRAAALGVGDAHEVDEHDVVVRALPDGELGDRLHAVFVDTDERELVGLANVEHDVVADRDADQLAQPFEGVGAGVGADAAISEPGVVAARGQDAHVGRVARL